MTQENGDESLKRCQTTRANARKREKIFRFITSFTKKCELL
ncbi:hypothetical protein M5D96_010382 [Drosophila gunungcola]|uniref:Uncharacterized protein n=1 Tax=Drosophila gunungcola TaxID=103775 RepID=A0A9P9YI86_9MUSC|nr:hypothetical protein M5D96_010382 [Drosophila gunungcola]